MSQLQSISEGKPKKHLQQCVCGGFHWEYVVTRAEAEKALGVEIVD